MEAGPCSSGLHGVILFYPGEGAATVSRSSRLAHHTTRGVRVESAGSPSVADQRADPRYHRQMLLEGIGQEGQHRLGESHALIVGCGALGCAAADLLARAGIGRLTIVDRDIVEMTNLQRQVLFDEADARHGVPKAHAAVRRLAQINSSIQLDGQIAEFAPNNAEQLAGVADDAPRPRADVILDGTDNYQTRYLLNDLAVRHGIPYLYAGVVATRGMTMAIIPGVSPCLRCLFENPPPAGSGETCDTIGVLASAVAAVASVQVTEAIKILIGRHDLLVGSLISFDLWTGTRQVIDTRGARRADCPCCGLRDFAFLEGDVQDRVTRLCGRGAVQVVPARTGQIDLAQLAVRLASHGSFKANDLILRGEFHAENAQGDKAIGLTVFADARALVHGTEDLLRARAIYDRYIGS